ncbi:MAG: T9SS type A sorting domain-containing protein [Chitinophagaceae bacterium]|nr:T9SS type A sorting domain-containing protein [Chitinophagaceae bacterium]
MMKNYFVFAIAILFLSFSFIISQKTFDTNETGLTKKEKNAQEENEEFEKESGAALQLSSWFQSKGYPNPENLNGKYQQAWEEYKAIKKNTESILQTGEIYRIQGQVSNWSSLGDVADIAGRILCIEVDPNNSNTVWAGSAGGGIWKSTNGASSWSGVQTDFPVLGVPSIVVNPLKSSVVYAGTGEVYRTDTSNTGFNVWKTRGTYGVGILKTTDGGATWTQVLSKTSNQLFGIQMLKFDPIDTSIIYACATDGLYRTTNSGATWNKILNKIYVSDVCINPSNTNQIVVGVGNLTNTDRGIYRTTNGSSGSPSWTKISSGLPTNNVGYIRLDNVGSNRLYASIGRSSGNELYLSTDFGSNWYAKNSSSHTSYQYWFAHTLAINPSNTNQVIFGGVNFYRYTSSNTTTGGSSSSLSSSVHADFHDIEYDPNNSNTVYVACDGGVYKSTNGGSSWSVRNTGLRATQFYASFGVDPTNANRLIGGLQDNGVVSYNGSSWSKEFGGDGGACAVAPNGSTVLACNDARAVQRSTNGVTGPFSNALSSWAFVADDRTAFMVPIAISKSDGNYMYVASDNIHRSTNGGSSWTNTSTSSSNYIDQYRKTAIAFAVSPTNPNKVYVSTSNIAQNTSNDYLWVTGQPNVLKSTTPNTTPYTSIKGSLPDRFVMDFAISENDDDSVYIAVGGFGTSHIYLTPDGGNTWISRGSGLPDVPFNAVLIDPTNPNIIYAGCDFGVYVSADRGQNWYDYNTGFYDATLVMDLQVDANNKLIAATHGKGVFRSDLFVPPVTLPVHFISFAGQNNDDMNNLQWKVDNEYNLSHYEIQRSLDGSYFENIQSVDAFNNASARTYQYGDRIGQIHAAKYYYRLKAIDIDGSYYYSDIIVLKTSNNSGMEVVGNPFTNDLHFKYNSTSGGAMRIRLFDMQGKMLKQESTKIAAGLGHYYLNNLSFLPKGMYILAVEINEQRYTKKVLKQ